MYHASHNNGWFRPKKSKTKKIPYQVYWWEKGEYGKERVKRMIDRKTKRHAKKKYDKDMARKTERDYYDWEYDY